MPSKFKKNTAIINKRKTFYWEKNHIQKQVVVLLHGFPGTHDGMIDLANKLGNYRIIIPDLPACGESEQLAGKHNLKNYSDWLNNFLNELSIKEAIVIGHSFGSRIALVFSGEHPEKMKKLILITPVLKVEGLLCRIVSAYYGIAGFLPKYIQKIMFTNGFGKKMGDLYIFKSADKKIHKKIIQRDVKEIKKINPQVNIEIFDEFYKFSLIPEGQKVKEDSLIIAGDLDEVSPLASIKELAGQLPNAKLEIMKGCGHLVPLENPQATADIINKWLKYENTNC